MRTEFAAEVLRRLIEDGQLDIEDSIVAVCGTRSDRDLLCALGLSRGAVTNIDQRLNHCDFTPFTYTHADAQSLVFANGAFDFAFVSDGLHHCSSPHRALIEMYRVARKGIIVLESRDSLAVRIATQLGLSAEYEVEAVADSNGIMGGRDNSSIPNYVYRWTEREFEKTINAYDPTGSHEFRYFYRMHLPLDRIVRFHGRRRMAILNATKPLAWAVSRALPRQSNSFAMIALRPRQPWPWLPS